MVHSLKLKLSVLRSTNIIKNKQIIQVFNISKQSIYNWKANKNNTGTYKTRDSKYTPEIRIFIRQYVISKINFSMNTLISKIQKKFKIYSSKSSIYNILKTLHITNKKIRKKTILKNTKFIKQQILHFKKNIKNIPKNKIISIDESSYDTHLSPNYGWSKVGKPIIKIQSNKYKRYTIICAISNQKIIYYTIIKGSSNAVMFKDFLENVITKTNDNYATILLDNARIHHSKIVKEYMLTKKSNLLFNVPYCPELNPIEKVFSKSKFIVKKFDNNFNEKNLFKNIKKSLNMITSNDLNNFYSNCF
jgi:transposase